MVLLEEIGEKDLVASWANMDEGISPSLFCSSYCVTEDSPSLDHKVSLEEFITTMALERGLDVGFYMENSELRRGPLDATDDPQRLVGIGSKNSSSLLKLCKSISSRRLSIMSMSSESFAYQQQTFVTFAIVSMVSTFTSFGNTRTGRGNSLIHRR